MKPGPAIRTKPIRITLDLSRADYQSLNRWLAKAGVELDQPMSRLTPRPGGAGNDPRNHH